MNKKRFIISIIFIILGIQSNVMGANSSNVQIVKHKEIKNTHKINENQSIDLPIENDKKYHSKMNYNQHLSTNKYYLMMVGNFLNIISCIFLIFNLLELIKINDSEKLKFICLIILLILSLITILILLYDFNKYKKAKNSNDINQYNKYIIDDNNIDQLTKQRRYNFINGLSIGIFLIWGLLLFIKKNIVSDIKKIILELFENKFDEIQALLLQTIFIITFTLQIIYIILLTIDNKNNIWNSIKNSIHKQDIVFYIIYLFSIIIGVIGLYYLNDFLYTKEREEFAKSYNESITKNQINKTLTQSNIISDGIIE